jgi:benzodiazapine receptor
VKKVYLLILFLSLNFGGLALGNWFMGDAVTSAFYSSLNKAPWTPPGWVFGIVWTFIMLCFSWYLAELFVLRATPRLLQVYAFALSLNVSWNWVFFNQKAMSIGLIILIVLTFLIFYFFITFRSDRLKYAKYLLVPYLIWLCIATSLNGYIVFNN